MRFADCVERNLLLEEPVLSDAFYDAFYMSALSLASILRSHVSGSIASSCCPYLRGSVFLALLASSDFLG